MSDQEEKEKQLELQWRWERMKMEHELKTRAAERAHDLSNDLGKRIMDAAGKDAQEAIKAALLINGGAAVAVLAFLAAVISKRPLAREALQPVVESLGYFCGGLILAMVTAGIAYVTNSLYAANHFTQDKIWKHPYVEGTKKSRRRYWWALALNILGLVLITAAVGAFVWGVYIAATSILELATTRELPFIDG